MRPYITAYYVLINMTAFLLFWADKRRAVRPERGGRNGGSRKALAWVFPPFLGDEAGAPPPMLLCLPTTNKGLFSLLLLVFPRRQQTGSLPYCSVPALLYGFVPPDLIFSWLCLFVSFCRGRVCVALASSFYLVSLFRLTSTSRIFYHS